MALSGSPLPPVSPTAGRPASPPTRAPCRFARPRRLLAVIGVLAAAAVAGAFVLQWGFGVEPCVLCLYQRLPHGAVAAIALAGALLAVGPRTARVLLLLCAGLFTAGAGLAIYHVGIEQHWWAAAAGCTVDALPTFTVEDLQASMFAPAKPCDEVDFRVLGFSLAGWNALASTALAAGCLAAARVRPSPAGAGAR